MGLFTNKPQATDTIQFTSISLNKTLLLVGLGNYGAAYDLTRHNVGFAALDSFVAATSEMSSWVAKKDLKCLLSSGTLGQNRVIAIKPTTFMNLSGEALQAVTRFYKITAAQTLVLHDELDVNFGQIRLRTGGSAAGHNGIRSVSQHIGEDYGRMRIGIGPKQPSHIDSADFVLQKFTASEQIEIKHLCRESNSILSEYIYGGSLPSDTRSFII